MWLYQFTIRNKALIYSIYLIFLFLGLLTLWRWGFKLSIEQDYLLFRPLLISLVLVLVLIKLVRSIYYTAFVALQLVSVLIITTVYIELSSLNLTLEELIGASIYLIAVSSVIALFTFEHHRGLLRAVGKAVLYSATFFSLLLISKLFIPLGTLQSSVFLVLIVGQVVAYFVSLIFLPLLSHFINQREQGMDQVSQLGMDQVSQSGKKIGKRNSFLIWVFGLVVIASLFFIHQINFDYSLAFIWCFSLFLIAGIYNSFRKSLIIHSLLLLYIPSLVISYVVHGYFEQGTFLVHPNSMDMDLLMGLVLSWGIGMFPLLTWVYTRDLHWRLYSLSLVIYVVALLPLVVGLGGELGLKWITFMMIVGYSIVNSLSLAYYPAMETMIYSDKKRADRPFKGLEISEKMKRSNLRNQSIISADERERSLVTEYGEWLRKREQRLEQDQNHRNDAN